MAAIVKRILLLPLLLACARNSIAQASPARDLSHYTRAQLQACYKNLQLCGASDEEAITSELYSRLPSLPIPTLIRCFSNWRICGAADSTATGWLISDELVRRGAFNQALSRYGHTLNPDIRDGLEHAAYSSNGQSARVFMKYVFSERLDDGEDLYWPAMYLAKQYDVQALQYLNPGQEFSFIGNKFSVSSAQFAETATLFGKCRYRPAIPYLIKPGLHAASLNLVDAADQSLHRFYPNAPSTFHSLEAEQRYFCKRADHDGFHLHCSED